MAFGNIKAVAVGRLSDRTLVATYIHARGEVNAQKFSTVAAKILGSDRVSEYARLTITDRDLGSVHYDSDTNAIYLVVANPSYPQRTVFQMLEEFKSNFGGRFGSTLGVCKEGSLSSGDGKRIMSDVCAKYDDLSRVDKVSSVTSQVEDVKAVMQDNVTQMLKNQDNLQVLETKADGLQGEAKTFKQTATKVRKQACMSNIKMWIILIAVIVIIIIGIVLGVVLSNNGSAPAPAPTPSP